MLTLEEEIAKLDLIASDAFEGGDADEFRQLAEWLKRLKRIEDYIAEGKDDMECTYSLCFWEIEAVMNGEI